MKVLLISTFVVFSQLSLGLGLIDVHVTCDSVVWLYADDQQVVGPGSFDYDNWDITKNAQVPDSTKVFGIKCVSDGDQAGLIASFDDSDNTVTDGNWRCTKTDPGGAGWLSDAYDDSGWSPAFAIKQNSGNPQPWGVRPGISNEAKWIWTPGWQGQDKTVWCRKLKQEHIDARITCDNNLWFYADGKALVDSSTNGFDDWTVTKNVEVPADTRVYAIKCVDLHVIAGILASFSDGTVTDRTWRCTNTDPGQSWLSEAFDDIGWQVATKIFQNTGNVPSWNVRTDIDSDAEWIWTTGWHGEDKTIWCRKVVAEECRSSLIPWSQSGCIWDWMDSCITYDQKQQCGWGYRRHYYFCGPSDVRQCTYTCYKPCPGRTLSDCAKQTLSGFSIVRNSECSSTCGVGMVTLLWKYPSPTRYVICQEECCCDRCAGSGGNQPVRVCDNNNMALPLSDLPGMCPHHIF